MTNYNGPHTELSHEAMTKVPAGPHEFISWNDCGALMDLPSGTRPRVYGYAERGTYAGQIIAIRSRHDMDTHGPALGFIWLSRTTLADLVRPA